MRWRLLNHQKYSAERGDTIVEVVLALTVLGVVLGSASVLANRNARTLQDTQEHSVAVRLAQGQMELVTSGIAVPVGIDFCIASNGTNVAVHNAAASQCVYDTGGGAVYRKSLRLTPKGTNGYVATASVKWEGLLRDEASTSLDQRFYGHTAGTVLGAPAVQYSQSGSGGGTAIVAGGGAPTIRISASTTTAPAGGPVTLSWSTKNSINTTCEASGAWNGTLDVSGSRVVYPPAESIYTISCTNGTTTTRDSVVVKMRPPRVPLYLCYQYHTDPNSMFILTNHILTLNPAQCNGGYAGGAMYGIVGYAPISPTKNPGAIPMYNAYKPSYVDDFYTVTKSEYDYARANYGYTVDKGVPFYVYPSVGRATCNVEGTTPLYRWNSDTVANHYYTTSDVGPNSKLSYVDGGGTFMQEQTQGCIFSRE